MLTINTLIKDIKSVQVCNHYLSDIGASCKVFVMTNKTGKPIVKCYELVPLKRTFADILLGRHWVKYKVKVRWYRDCIVFSGSGSGFAKESYDERFDIEHAMHYAKVRDKYSGGDIVCQTLK